jgi:hypothetical protein
MENRKGKQQATVEGCRREKTPSLGPAFNIVLNLTFLVKFPAERGRRLSLRQ